MADIGTRVSGYQVAIAISSAEVAAFADGLAASPPTIDAFPGVHVNGVLTPPSFGAEPSVNNLPEVNEPIQPQVGGQATRPSTELVVNYIDDDDGQEAMIAAAGTNRLIRRRIALDKTLREAITKPEAADKFKDWYAIVEVGQPTPDQDVNGAQIMRFPLAFKSNVIGPIDTPTA